MVMIAFLLPNGQRQEVDVREGRSLMEGALREGIDGIVAECGGQCNCGTCHVYVEAERLPELPPISETEEAMLETVAAERRSNSRLSCQIRATAALGGLAVTVPERQY
ncbi:MAG TPA: 2Fe-2S iron-sulfur cluster-binding protein [Bauldia sp.]|nr:2Fe-2S iron-sulfur cluster-binding protein [Bauldia sp.]